MLKSPFLTKISNSKDAFNGNMHLLTHTSPLLSLVTDYNLFMFFIYRRTKLGIPVMALQAFNLTNMLLANLALAEARIGSFFGRIG